MKSVMTHQFSQVPTVEIPRSSFDRSHGLKTTFDAGYLIPIYVDEALPGDSFSLNMSGFARLATQIFPIMDNLRMETFFFAVPYRLIWDNWKKFCGEQTDPGDSIEYTIPVNADGQNFANQTIFDYMGLPTQVNAKYEFSVLPFRAYNLIWNEWFRDQNLQDSVTVLKTDADETTANFNLLKRGKRHDYFTSCLPWLQKGDSVEINLGTVAPVGVTNVGAGGANVGSWDMASGTWKVMNAGSTYVTTSNNAHVAGANYQLYADLESAQAATVNELRECIQIQRMLERDARAGTRYTEIVKSHFGVISPDGRLQRPEYLGGGSTPVNISAIAQTDTNVGDLAGIGVANFRGHGFTKSFTEHCIIIGMVNVRADLTYQQGLDRMWSRSTRYDFFWPTLAHLGEQAVLNKEIFVDAAAVAAGSGEGGIDDVFGYQERYAEYRFKPSKITGKLRSNDANSLDAWHLSEEFSALPTLDDIFIVDNTPVDRIIAVPSEPHFIFDSYFELKCARPMPVYSIPGLIDHF